MRIPHLNVLAGFSLVVSAALVILGWLTHHPALAQLVPGFEAMTLPAAAGFCLAGIALIATKPVYAPEPSEASGPDSDKSVSRVIDTAPPPGVPHVGTLLASLLLGLGMLAVLLWIGLEDIDQWLHQAGYHWIAEAGAQLARMRPISAVGFIVAGVVLLLLNRASTAAMPPLVLHLTLAISLMGLLGIVGQLLGLEEIYKGYPGTALHSGIGFVICGIGLLSIEYRDDRFQRYWRQDESRRINLVGGTLLLLTGLIGVFGGFAVLHPLTVNELQSNLQLGLKSRSEMFKNGIEQAWQDSSTFAAGPLRLDAMRRLDSNPNDEAARATLQTVTESAPAFGFSAIVLRDAAGREVARAGSFVSNPELRVTLNTLSPSVLLWKNGFVLHTRTGMVTGGHLVGTLEAERMLPLLGKALHDTAYLGSTTDFAVCAPAGENMHCFPFRSTGGKVLLNLPPRLNGQPIPMSYALAGKTGVIHTKDYRGREVIAAYASLGTLGLGTVLKIDSAELYEPIAETLGRLLAVLTLLLAAGIVVLRLQVLPLVRKMVKEIHERKQAEAQISYLANHDVLTDLPNRLLVHDRFDQAMAHARRDGSKTALLFIDLDNFKEINDSLGHSIGDALLKAVARRLRDCLRTTDSISRQGGDEFLIVLTDVRDSTDITGVMEKIMALQMEPFHIDDYELTSSLSVGITVSPDDGNDFETLLKKADTAMYHAKDAGRNTFRFFTEQMNIDAVEQLRMHQSLTKALERNEFALHYQPLIELASGDVVGAEALLRWNHPERGMVPPVSFIPCAEESGLIVPIGEWVLREVCRQAVAWRAAGLPELVVAVNLSAVQFKRGDLEKSVSLALTESGLDPACLELELTESILIQDSENMLATVQRLKSLGITLSIDDFGTGYSSLSYLKRFAVDRLKIDQSFILDMVDNPIDAAIVYAIIQMAKALNLKTVAEGVEDERMLVLLRQHQCDWVQGYHFARPMPADEFACYLTAVCCRNASGPDIPDDTQNEGKQG